MGFIGIFFIPSVATFSGDVEQGRVFVGEGGHRGDEEDPNEAHCDKQLHREDGVDLPDEVSPDGLVGEAAAYGNPLGTLLSSKIVGIRLHNSKISCRSESSNKS